MPENPPCDACGEASCASPFNSSRPTWDSESELGDGLSLCRACWVTNAHKVRDAIRSRRAAAERVANETPAPEPRAAEDSGRSDPYRRTDGLTDAQIAEAMAIIGVGNGRRCPHCAGRVDHLRHYCRTCGVTEKELACGKPPDELNRLAAARARRAARTVPPQPASDRRDPADWDCWATPTWETD